MNNRPPYQPEGYSSLTLCLNVRGAARAIDFYAQALGASEIFRMTDDDGTIAHAEMRIGDTVLMLCDEMPQAGAVSPETVGGCPISLRIYVADAESTFAGAIAAGATSLQPVETTPRGERAGMMRDPFGFRWTISTPLASLASNPLDDLRDTVTEFEVAHPKVSEAVGQVATTLSNMGI
jgi:PhnB protein